MKNTFRYNVGDEAHEEYCDWEVDWEKIDNAIVDILHQRYPKLDKDELAWFLSNEDLYEHFEDELEDELKDYFEDDFKEQWYDWYLDSHSRYD